MPRRKRDQPMPPGSFYARSGRIWWAGRLPGEKRRRARPVAADGARYALVDNADNRGVAR